MTLSASDPWATVLTALVPVWVADLPPDLGAVSVVVARQTVVVTATDPWATVRILAAEVAPWWPGWLHPAGVRCRIVAGGVTLTADADAMFDLAALLALG